MRSLPNRAALENKELTRANNNQLDFTIAMGRGTIGVDTPADYRTEVIRVEGALSEIEVAPRRQYLTQSPDYLFEIHIDNGEVKTASRHFPKLTGEEWRDEFSLGQGKAVSICFDGTWRAIGGKYQFTTDEYPWLFYVDNAGDLWAQYWNMTTERVKIGENVQEVHAVRGWRDVYAKSDTDQHLIVVYRMADGTLYARELLGNGFGSPAQVPGIAGVSSFKLFELNDYRGGISAQTASGTKLIISKRNWSGMGFRGENIELFTRFGVRFSALRNFYPYANENIDLLQSLTTRLGYTETDQQLLFAYNEGSRIIAGFLHVLGEMSLNGFVANDEENRVMGARQVLLLGRWTNEQHKPWVYAIDFPNLNNYAGDITLTASGQKNAEGEIYDTVSNTFTPTGLVPIAEIPPAPVSAENPSDTEIVLTFDKDIHDAGGSLNAFTVTSTAHPTTMSQDIVTDTHAVSAVRIASERTVTLTLESTSRIRRAIAVTISYANGTMYGNAEPVSAFTIDFTPVIYSYSNNGDSEYENIDLVQSLTTRFEEVDYRSPVASEYIELAASFGVRFTDASNYNP